MGLQDGVGWEAYLGYGRMVPVVPNSDAAARMQCRNRCFRRLYARRQCQNSKNVSAETGVSDQIHCRHVWSTHGGRATSAGACDHITRPRNGACFETRRFVAAAAKQVRREAADAQIAASRVLGEHMQEENAVETAGA